MIKPLFFRISRLLHYVFNAKGKHSIHSPVLFNLLNEHLRTANNSNHRNQRILDALISCFEIQSVYVENDMATLNLNTLKHQKKNTADLLITTSDSILKDEPLATAENKQIIVLLDLNKNSSNFKSFIHLKSSKKVTFSLDMWTIGILICNYPSVRQDFILRYF